jgi:uncharacterized protein
VAHSRSQAVGDRRCEPVPIITQTKESFVKVGIRRSIFALVIAGGAAGPMDVQAQAGDEWAVSSWGGTLMAGAQEIPMVFHVTRAEDGSLTGTLDVQGVSLPLTTVTATESLLTMTFPVPGGGTYEGPADASGDALEGTFTQAGQSFPMKLERTEGGAPAPPLRPQEPKEPFPYAIEDVTFANSEAGITLAGTVTMPAGDGPFPAAILVSGSGPQDRDETLLGHKPFLVLADHLTRQGIAVLRYDDRGVADSEGDFGAATSEDFASDALAAVQYLAAQPKVASAEVGIIGHSEGGLVGPMAATRSSTVGFVVMLAGPGVTGLEILIEQGRLINDAAGAAPEVTALNARIQESLAAIIASEPDAEVAAPLMKTAMRAEFDGISPELRAAAGDAFSDAVIDQTVQQLNTPWFRFFFDYDPRPALESMTVPVLSLIGEKDLQVPHKQNIPEIEAAFSRSAHSDATVLMLPGLNHLFQQAETGSPSEYQNIEQTFSPEALEVVSSWIRERFNGHTISDR